MCVLRDLRPFVCPFVPGDKLRCLANMGGSKAGDECVVFAILSSSMIVFGAKCTDARDRERHYGFENCSNLKKIAAFRIERDGDKPIQKCCCKCFEHTHDAESDDEEMVAPTVAMM